MFLIVRRIRSEITALTEENNVDDTMTDLEHGQSQRNHLKISFAQVSRFFFLSRKARFIRHILTECNSAASPFDVVDMLLRGRGYIYPVARGGAREILEGCDDVAELEFVVQPSAGGDLRTRRMTVVPEPKNSR